MEHKEHLTHTVWVYTHTQTPHAVAAGWQARLPNNSIKQKRGRKRKRRNRGEKERERKRKACSLSAARPPLRGKKGRNTSEIKKRREEKKKGRVWKEKALWCVNWHSGPQGSAGAQVKLRATGSLPRRQGHPAQTVCLCVWESDCECVHVCSSLQSGENSL